MSQILHGNGLELGEGVREMLLKVLIAIFVSLRSKHHKFWHWIAELAQLQECERFLADGLLGVRLTARTRNHETAFGRLNSACFFDRSCLRRERSSATALRSPWRASRIRERFLFAFSMSSHGAGGCRIR